MKIALEANVLAHNAQTGVYYYTQRLIGAAMKLDPLNTYALVYFGASRKAQGFGLPLENVEVRAISWFPRKLYNLLLRTHLKVPIDRLAGTDADIFIFPTFARWPLARTPKSITIIYDTIYADRPGDIKTSHFRRYLSKAVPKALEQSSKIITISAHTKQRLIDLYNTPAEKIVVINPAIDASEFKPASRHEISTITAAYGITRKYLLYLGTLEPRKNITSIIKAYQSLPSELRQEYQLVLAGGRGWGSADIEQELLKLQSSELVQTGYVAQEHRAALYSGATVFLFPSFFEGWGMPIVEAQACGTPVITADNSSLPEAGGNAAEYVMTNDQQDLNKKLKLLLGDPQRREAMREQGLEYARNFTWEKSAQKLLDVIEALPTSNK